jgi:hypothetical protein
LHSLLTSRACVFESVPLPGEGIWRFNIDDPNERSMNTSARYKYLDRLGMNISASST